MNDNAIEHRLDMIDQRIDHMQENMGQRIGNIEQTFGQRMDHMEQVMELRFERTVTRSEFYWGLLMLAATLTGAVAMLLALFEYGGQ